MRNIPNILTLCNLAAGCLAIVFISRDQAESGLWAMFACVIFDFLDGAVARGLRLENRIGKELDSLADVVSFGVVPGMIFFQLINDLVLGPNLLWLPHIGFLFTLAAAWRLAKYNITDHAPGYFSGLPTPAASVFAGGLYWLAMLPTCDSCGEAFLQPFGLLGGLAFISMAMISSIPMFDLKLEDRKWSGNQIRYISIIAGFGLFLWLREVGLIMTVVLYIFLSLLLYSLRPSKNR